MRRLAASPAFLTLVSVLALMAPVNASELEDATGGAAAYQFDAGTHHDAPDDCSGASATWSFPLGGSTTGTLAPPDDMADVITFNVAAADVGSRIEVTVQPATGTDIDLMVHVPMCAGDVFAPQNQPKKAPSPPAAGPGQKQATVHNLGGTWTCDSTQWFFVINQLGGTPAPASIYVAWTDGSQETVPLKVSNQGVAHYSIQAHLGYQLENAWAVLPSTWAGKFEVGQAPCNTVHGGAVYGDPPTLVGTVLTFTPVKSGLHAVQVSVPPPEAPGPIVVPLTCHMCVPQLQAVYALVDYTVSAVKK